MRWVQLLAKIVTEYWYRAEITQRSRTPQSHPVHQVYQLPVSTSIPCTQLLSYIAMRTYMPKLYVLRNIIVLNVLKLHKKYYTYSTTTAGIDLQDSAWLYGR